MDNKWIKIAKEVLDAEAEAIYSVKNNLDNSFAKAIELIAASKGRVVVCGIGKSGLVGRKIAATFSSTGTPAFFLHPVEGAHGDLGAIRAEDVVIAISYSGKTNELNALLPSIRCIGTPIIALTSNNQSPLAKLADVVINIHISKEACPNNLAPTSSTTATLALGDALAICLMESKSFTAKDFKRFHPAGALGQRLALSVAEIMHSNNIPLVQAETLIEDALTKLNASGFGAVLVENDETLVGIVTDGDIRRAICSKQFDIKKTVKSIMTKNPLYAKPEQSAAEAIDSMEKKAITLLPVLDNDKKVLGIIHLHDILGKGSLSFS